MLSSCRFHHIEYAVHDIEKTASYYIEAGWHLSEIQIDRIQNTKIAFLSKPEMPLIELIAPVDDHSPINKTLEKSGVTPYHICYSVKNMSEAIQELKKKKFVLLFNPVEAIAMNNKKICFLFNKDIGLIELVEE